MITDPAQFQPRASRERITQRVTNELEAGTTPVLEAMRWFGHLLRVEGVNAHGKPATLDLDEVSVAELTARGWLCRVTPHDGGFKIEVITEDGFEPVAAAIHDDQHAAAVAALARARNIESPE